MAYRRRTASKKHLLAKIADKSAPCSFCRLEADDEAIYGKLYSIGDIHCHYFCVLLSCCLIQKGRDSEGLFGFLYPDILTEIERSKKHKCSYCHKEGATLGCSVTQCRKQFHLPCGRKRDVVSLFYGNFKSFCQNHAPKQKLPDVLMAKVKARRSRVRKIKDGKLDESALEVCESTCVICYEPVEGWPDTRTFWPPCCARDAWFHRNCIQRMALSAGVHYLKCPLCNDKDSFYEAVLSQGYYVPDRDASWELEENAFADIYERHISCAVEVCCCPGGREHDDESGPWDLSPCVLCGWSGAHATCGGAPWLCPACAPAAPDARALRGLHAQSLPEARARRGPRMPSRMSLRRTKTPGVHDEALRPSCSWGEGAATLESGPKTPRKSDGDDDADDRLVSPMKLLERSLNEKLPDGDVTIHTHVIMEMREKFKRPKPLMVKRRIVDDIVDGLLKDLELHKDHKMKEEIREHHSPEKKTAREVLEKMDSDVTVTTIDSEDASEDNAPQTDVSQELNAEENLTKMDPAKLTTVNIENDAMEISERNEVVNIDLIKLEPDVTPAVEKCSFKFSSTDKEVLEINQMDIDMESFKSQYLSEVGRNDRRCGEDVTKPAVRSSEVETDTPNGVERRGTRKCTSNGRRRRRRGKGVKKHAELSISNKDINVQIKIKDDDLEVKMRKNRRRREPIRVECSIKIDESPKVLRQYVISASSHIARPETDVTPVKKKRFKLDKSPDNLKQTSIASFFVVQNN